MSTLRTAPTEQHYRNRLKEGPKRLDKLPKIKEFKHFLIVRNEFPHDRIAHIHHMLVPKRVVEKWTQLNWRERREFKKIDAYLATRYDSIKRNYPSYISISYVVHWHLYVYYTSKRSKK